MQFLSFVPAYWFLTNRIVIFRMSPQGGMKFWPITAETLFNRGRKILQKAIAIWSLTEMMKRNVLPVFEQHFFFCIWVLTVLKRPIVTGETGRVNISSREQSKWNDDDTKVWLNKITELFTFHLYYACLLRLEGLGKPAWLACVRMKGFYTLLVLFSMLFCFTGGRPVSPGRGWCLGLC